MFLLSKPLRLRGLKWFSASPKGLCPLVEAFAASWIEIQNSKENYSRFHVEAFAASWIEMSTSCRSLSNSLSKPLRLRGLKFTTF